ncbi:MAG: sigma-70 family RNA polymerase sigma factor [Planctomycetaceae bacterium]|jgi:RNA polymerase sigma-70 factor, ECF subfamily|nr:sigma-70 family RNA polymerase sigma factor [Planctomycetaceae bacterium]MBT6483289.1 sigma-70 family RNA polymerase sigma factor [Planctomycetaceae bacterium]MBT6494616.1 sigma-70 family RNA polymerase sigma factor [Planctomycetaceae bacterium]
MDSTSVSLLRRLHTDEKEIAWKRFVELYAPLIYHWTLRAGLSDDDAADCVQDVLTLLVDKLPTFAYDPKKSFRAWLRTVTVNKCRETHRRNATVAKSTDPLKPDDAVSPDGVEGFTDQEYQRSLVHRALELMQREFEPNTWQACWKHVVSGDSASVIAQQLGMTRNAVYVAKSRVLRRLRDELDGLMD